VVVTGAVLAGGLTALTASLGDEVMRLLIR
jgi:hypothetical protein